MVVILFNLITCIKKKNDVEGSILIVKHGGHLILNNNQYTLVLQALNKEAAVENKLYLK